MTKNIIWLKNEINKQIDMYSQFEVTYTHGIVDGLRVALVLIEQLDSVDNDIKIRKRLDMLQHQIDSLESRLQNVEE